MTSDAKTLKYIQDTVMFTSPYMLARVISSETIPDIIREIEKAEAICNAKKLETIQKYDGEEERLKQELERTEKVRANQQEIRAIRKYARKAENLNRAIRVTKKDRLYILMGVSMREAGLKGLRAAIKAYKEQYCTPSNPEDYDFI